MNRTANVWLLAAVMAIVAAACTSSNESDVGSATTAPGPNGGDSGQRAGDDDDASARRADGDDGGTTPSSVGDSGPALFEGLDPSLCADPGAATSIIDETIVIGTSLPLSGGPSVLFAPFADGQRAYVDFYNDEFGGVDGIELEVVVKDDQANPDLTVSNVDELLFDNAVVAVAGVMGTDNNLAVRDQLNERCVPHLWAATGDAEWSAASTYPWTIGMSVPHEIEATVWADFAAAQGASSAATLIADTAEGTSYVEAFSAAATAADLDVVSAETIPSTFVGAPVDAVAELVATNPDAVFAAPLGAQCNAFMSELGAARAENPDFDPLVYLTASCAFPSFFAGVANNGNDGVYTSSNLVNFSSPGVLSENLAASDYVEAFRRTGSQADPAGVASAGWLSMELTVAAIQQAADRGDLTRLGIMDAARRLDISSSVVRPELVLRVDTADGFLAESTQLLQWSADVGGFVDIDDPVGLDGSLGID